MCLRDSRYKGDQHRRRGRGSLGVEGGSKLTSVVSDIYIRHQQHRMLSLISPLASWILQPCIVPCTHVPSIAYDPKFDITGSILTTIVEVGARDRSARYSLARDFDINKQRDWSTRFPTTALLSSRMIGIPYRSRKPRANPGHESMPEL